MSIATQQGDTGQTALSGGQRVSKADARVEAYGTVDELISALGFARSLCRREEIAARTKSIQRELFIIGSALATPEGQRKPQPPITDSLVDALTADVHRIETIEGVVGDWSLPGEDPVSAAFDIARTVCRRAERLAVRLSEQQFVVQPNVLRYLNRLSDLLWLFSRQIEVELGVDARLRQAGDDPRRWSRAW
jgi:cob(I)alamin adenosyltransferase